MAPRKSIDHGCLHCDSYVPPSRTWSVVLANGRRLAPYCTKLCARADSSAGPLFRGSRVVSPTMQEQPR